PTNRHLGSAQWPDSSIYPINPAGIPPLAVYSDLDQSAPSGGETGGTNRRTRPPDSATAVNATAMGSCRSGTSGRLAGDRDAGKNIYPCLSGGRETPNRKVPLDSPARRRVAGWPTI